MKNGRQKKKKSKTRIRRHDENKELFEKRTTKGRDRGADD